MIHTNQKIRIGIDLDDVLLDFNRALCVFHNKNYKTNLHIEDITQWELWNIWNCSRDEAIQRVLDFYHSPEHRAGLPVFGAQAAIAHLAQRYELFVITSKPDFLEQYTKKWLCTHFGNNFAGLVFTNDFSNKKKLKSEICNELNISIFIDDAPTHIIDLHTSGKKVFVFDRPWNQIDIPSETTRVFSWDDIVNKLIL